MVHRWVFGHHIICYTLPLSLMILFELLNLAQRVQSHYVMNRLFCFLLNLAVVNIVEDLDDLLFA